MPRTRPDPFLLAAAGVGLVHAAASASWGLGSPWLASTVGDWAVTWRAEEPLLVGAVLLVVAAVKTAAAVLPLVRHRLPSPRWTTTACAAGALGLAVYGLANAAGAWLVLSGLVGDPTADPAALWGHAALWDPLFAAWGLLLLTGLRRTTAAVAAAPNP
ncbi:DUF3995 domain-containing protein [Nocardioides litoris]|uniref:DUF3995 domain-containing protein n=1 Tax=Nocardioides litoris TaxID=1926648 RepID=UPI00111D6101|nr:DUF3995 domain-containing protein [Nocardioides litoris]